LIKPQRLATFSPMQQNKKEQLLKEIRRAENRIHELQKIIKNKPKTPLDKKIFAGHWRFFRVRADILRSSIGQQIQTIVDACNTFRLGKKKDYDSFRGTTEIAILIGATPMTLFSQEQGLRSLSQQDFEGLPLSETQKKKWFLKVDRTLNAGSKNIVIPRYFPRIPPHMIEYAYKPAYITEINTPDGDAESELVQLHQFMTKTNGWDKLYGSHRDEWNLNIKKKKVLQNLQNQEQEEERDLP
jgi:hypothetical protein